MQPLAVTSASLEVQCFSERTARQRRFRWNVRSYAAAILVLLGTACSEDAPPLTVRMNPKLATSRSQQTIRAAETRDYLLCSPQTRDVAVLLTTPHA